MKDDPIISAMERTGYPTWVKTVYPICPVCGCECDTFYRDRDGEIVGCDECVQTIDAWEAME